ncbi:MAG: HAD family hydrolase [Calditrichia bacterium]
MKTSSTLLLFDIDGTLMRTNRIPLKIVQSVVAEAFDSDIDWSPKDFAGSTDRKILRTLITKNNLQVSDIEATIDKLLDAYLSRLETTLANEEVVTLLPGVTNLLQETEDLGFAMGLVTGNVERGARLKLRPPKFNTFFPIGAFGSDAENRNLLPPIAAERAEKHFSKRFERQRSWVIGDTPHDVECAKVNGMRCLAVATGIYDEKALQGADVILPDLNDTEKIISIFNDYRLL